MLRFANVQGGFWLPDHDRAEAETPSAGDTARDRRRLIGARAEAEGFDTVAVTSAHLPDSARRDLGLFLDEGRHGDMTWMAQTQDRRGHPRALWPEAVSILTLGLSYAPAEDPLTVTRHPDRGAISVYSRGRDYHDIAKKRAKALARWMHATWGGAVKVFVDTAPVMEKPLAAQAGLGWAGKHTNLVSRRFGSWLFLAEVFTTLEVAADAPHADRCGSCARCLHACPTGALDPAAPYRIDARLCVSYLTIEHKGPLPRPVRRAMGNRIYGCDDCLAVCPWTRFAPPSPHDGLWPRLELNTPRLADLAALDDASFRAVFSGSPIKRTGRARFVRNVMVALGNSGRPDLARVVERALDDDSALVRGTAVWALRRLWADTGPDLAAARARHLAREDDAAARAEWDGGTDDPLTTARVPPSGR